MFEHWNYQNPWNGFISSYEVSKSLISVILFMWPLDVLSCSGVKQEQQQFVYK